MLALDLILPALTGIVTAVSIKLVRSVSVKSRGIVKTGSLGIAAAISAGECPCLYLAPLLAVAGSVGGALGAIHTRSGQKSQDPNPHSNQRAQ